MAAFENALNELNAATASPSGGAANAPDNVRQFVDRYTPLAKQVAERTGNDPSLYLAQWGLETGWGKSVIPGSNNLGNIKDFSGNGISATDNATGSRDKYRAYGSPEDFADDYTALLNRRYKGALGVGNDPEAFADALKRSGYAEDPNYVSKIMAAHGMLSGKSPATPSAKNAAPKTDFGQAFEHFADTPNSTLDAQLKAGSSPSENKLSVSKEIGAAIDSYQANLWAIPAAMGSDYALQAMQSNKASAEKAWQESGAPQSFDEMEFGKNFGEYFAHMALQSAPYMVEFMATGFGVGTLAKSALAKTAKGVAEKAAAEATKIGATKAAAEKAGEAAAAQYMGKVYTASGVAGSYPSAVGDILSNQHEQAGKFDLTTAAVLGVPYAALNAAGVEGMAVRAAARGLPKSLIAKDGVAGFAGRATLTGAEAGVMEGSTETGQEVMNQLGRMAVDPNASLTDQRALDAYKESFVAGALLGGIPGASAGGFRKHEDELRGLAAQHAAQQAASAPKPNSPLTNATNAAQSADPINAALSPITQRLSDRGFYDQIRNHPNLGPDSLSQILSSYRIATNATIDPLARQSAVDRLTEFFKNFDNQPNFTLGETQAQPEAQDGGAGLPVVAGGTGVGPTDPRVGSIDGEATRVDQDLRGNLLDRVLESNPDNPNRAFDRALRLEGFRDSTFTDGEKAKIDHFNALRAATISPAVSGFDPVSGAPAGRYQHLSNMLDAGWAPASNGQLVSPGGEVYGLKGAGEMQFVRNKLNQKARNGNQAVGNDPQGGSAQGDLGAGGAGVDGTAPQGDGDESGRAGQGQNSAAPDGAVSPANAAGASVEPNGALAENENPAAPRVTTPENKQRWIYDSDRNVVETMAIHDVEYSELPGRKFFTRQQDDGNFSVTDEYSGGGAFLNAPTEADAIGGLQQFMHKAGVDKVRATLEAQPKIEAPKQAESLPTAAPDQEPVKNVNASAATVRAESSVPDQDPIKKDAPAAKSSVVRTYKTKSGKIGARIEKVVGPTGKVFYNYTGEWGAGSGHMLVQMDKIESMWRKEKRGYTVVEPEVTSEIARKGEFTLKNGDLARVVEAANRGVFTVSIGNAKGENMESMGRFQMDDQQSVSRIEARANWAMDNVKDAANQFAMAQRNAVQPGSAASHAAEDVKDVEANNPDTTTEQAPSKVDTSMRDAGAKAFADGLPRTAPEGIKGADRVRWLTGYDGAVKTSKNSPGSNERFVVAPDGSIDFGEVTPDMARAMRRQAGKIRLERGNTNFGLQHIEERHGAQIRGLGFDSIESFVADAVRHVDAIWKPSKSAQLVVVQSVERGKAVFIELKPSESGEYYTVNTAFPVSGDYAERKSGWSLLWGGASVPAVSSGDNPLAESSPNAGTTTAMTPGQSSDSNVAPDVQTDKQSTAAAYSDDSELQDALSHLGDVLGDVFGAKLNITGKQYGASDLLPAMSKVIELLIKKGAKSFREAVGGATNAMRGHAATKGFVDQITPRQWKAAYNSVAEFHEGTESEEDVAKYSAEQIQKIIALPEKIKEAEQKTDHGATPGQKEAGNYPKGKFAWHGLNIAVETAKGEDRTDKETNGDKWRVKMPATYGYILGTIGADKDHVDVFMGDKPESQRVYVINQTKPDSTEFDEHKVMLGYDSEDRAMVDYLLSFTGTFGHSVLGSISGPYAVEDFKHMLEADRFKKADPLGESLAYVNPRMQEQAAAEKYAETVASIKAKREERAIPTLDKITVTRSAMLDGDGVEYDQQADEALKEIDDQMTLGKRLLECLAA